ncbi:MAG: hypothetical protein Q8T09_19465 [Candidatus Melainabacteria bacterium]|nr:hypothetical protein [Candidatus Melainabacteria bacterium]
MGTKGGEDELGSSGARPGLATRVGLDPAFAGGDGGKLTAGGAREGSSGAALGTGDGGGAALGTGDGGGNIASEDASSWIGAKGPSASLARAGAAAIVAALPSEAVESKTVMLKAILALARIHLSP